MIGRVSPGLKPYFLTLPTKLIPNVVADLAFESKKIVSPSAITKEPVAQIGSEWIVGGGEMGQLIRALDWSPTPLGPIASWPQSLRTTVNLCLASDLPICIIWGPELVQIYNDGYRVICGEKHPRSMGQNFPECWREAWPVIGAAHDSALQGDTAFLENQHIFLERHGYVEECFFTFSFSPIRDETGRLAGLFHPVIETTPKMLGERRTRTLRDLASGVMNAKSVADAFTLSVQTLPDAALDLPFLLIYRLDETEKRANLVAATGLEPGSLGAPEIVTLSAPDHATWPLAEVFRMGKPMLVADVATRFGSFTSGPYPEFIASVMMLPITMPGAERPVAVVIAGISPRLRSDEMYVGFHDLLCGAITTAVANADAYEAERSRAEAFAKIDRAKTEFFSNVSHEFRTPLTLMLGPLEDALAGTNLPVHERGLIDVAHRNSQRLLKLVNSLLDFSRIEAGRAQATYEPVDLAALTAELASNFQSACERAELQLVLDCPPLPEPVFVDRDMWEKIVLNLLSNAFKFTFEGEIEIRLRADGGHVKLTVSDTGVGIPLAELPRVFERFHRVENQKGRSFEGSGIGLSLVHELVKLHGGSVHVDSEVGRGTEFTVSIPFGTEHLPHDRALGEREAASTAVSAHAYVQEALRWLPDANSAEALTEDSDVEASADPSAFSNAGRSKILLADDNADMRDYIRRLLGKHHDVEAVADGEAALEAVQKHRPDLVITDVMMPKLDGLELARAIRDSAKLSDLPIIMLSARAGEEASIEGLSAGADDYLVKPFSARELIARVNGTLVMARLRRENAEVLRELNATLEQRVADRTAEHDRVWRNSRDMLVIATADGIFRAVNPAWTTILGYEPSELIGHSFSEFVWPDDAETARSAVDASVAGEKLNGFENRYRHKNGTLCWISWQTSYEDGIIYGYARDITADKERTSELVLAQEALRQSQKLEAMGQLTGGVAHDFNNLLTPIVGGLDMLQRGGVGGPREQRLIAGALQSADRAKILVQRLLAFARRQPLRTETVDVRALIEGMGDLVSSTTGPQIKVAVDVAPGPIAAKADANQLEMAILNLSVNARDAMPEGGTLRISAEFEIVDAGHRCKCAAGDYVRISIADTGVGMDEATRARAIEPFFSTKGVGKGTGLGLSMVHGLISQLGGAMAVSSSVGLGTNVELWLPAADSAVEANVPSAAVIQTNGMPGVALVVDDEDLVRACTADMLSELGYQVVEAPSAEEALRLVRGGLRPEFLITDHLMPGMNGTDLARIVQLEVPGLHVLLVSGYADSDGVAPDLARLTKPFRNEELAASLSDLRITTRP